jgi:hypothetical protein
MTFYHPPHNISTMTFKNQLCILFFLAIQCQLFAQRDTSYQTIRQESGEYSAPRIETPSDRLFRTRTPAKWMFKMNLAQTFLFGDNDPQTGVEYKISPAFSVGAYYGMRLGRQGDGGWLHPLSLAVEGRWYHDMKKRISAGRSANNFGGKYLALEAGIVNSPEAAESWDERRIALRYGLQQRFMRNGYFDVSIGAGISNPSPIFRSSTFSIDQRVSVGLAAFLPRPKTTTASSDLCEVLHCQDEQYSMLKIDVFDIFRFWSNGDNFFFSLRPNIAYEQKIGRSPFSVELDLAARYDRVRYPTFTDIRFASAYWNATGEVKWYYNMRKRILNGRSGNNLSGAFIGLQLERNNLIKRSVNYSSDGSGVFDFSVVTGDYWAGNLVWGIQQRIFERGFIQFKIGPGSTFGGHNYRYEGADIPLTKIARRNELNIVADLKVGFAF